MTLNFLCSLALNLWFSN